MAFNRIDGPGGVAVLRRLGGGEGRALLALGQGAQQVLVLFLGGVENGRGRHVAEQADAGQAAAGLGHHQHGVERAEPGAAAGLGDDQARPAGLAAHVPEVEALALVQRVAGGLDGGVARERAAGGLAEELLLVGELEVHLDHSPFLLLGPQL